jgi:uncharacterized protein (DUF433 family)
MSMPCISGDITRFQNWTFDLPWLKSPDRSDLDAEQPRSAIDASGERGSHIRLDLPELREEPAGTYRVGKSRVTLDVVIEELDMGMTPEQIVSAFDTLAFADVQAVAAFYERHRHAVRSYVARREKEADGFRKTFEGRGRSISREELLARRRATEKDNAPTGQ